MATEKVLKARLQNKYETLENWNALPRGSFIPLKGELCFASDKDNAYGYYKVGDGETDFVDLPWLLNQGNWNENSKNTPGYIKNRPMYTEIPEDAEAILEIGYKSGDEISGAMIAEGTTAIMGEGREFTREDVSKAWEFKVNIKSDNDINPIDLFIEGPIYLKEINIDDDIIYYYGNFYRFYLMYAISELEEEIASGEITVEQIEQILQEELQLQDTGENYAFVNMYGTFFAVAFDQTPGDINNFTYEFNIYSYTTIVHKLDSKYLEEVNLVGKFENIDEFSEIFNDYANNRAQSPYSHAEGQQTKVVGSATAAHVEGYQTIVSSNYAHAEGQNNEASGTAAHVEGSKNEAQGSYSHSEGLYTKASNEADHSEGKCTIALGGSYWGPAHAEGYGAIATGTGTHAEGGIQLVQDYWTKFKEQGYYEYKASGATCTVASKSKINLSYPISYYSAIINVYSDEESFQVYNTGELVSGTLSDEIVEAGVLNNVYYRVYDENIGASGDYTHVEGYNNTAIGEYNHIEGNDNFADGDTNHVEGEHNFVDGNKNHVSGSYNKISGIGLFALGEGLINNGSINVGSKQIVLGRYNQNDQYADLIIGNGTDDNNRRNELTLQNGNLQVSGLINDGEENDVWKYISGKVSTNRAIYCNYFLENYNLSPQSQIINANKIKIQRTGGTKTIKIGNGNLLPLNWIESQTLDNGTSIVLNEDYSVTITAVPSETEQNIQIANVFGNWQVYDAQYAHMIDYYCWDENADSEIYYTMNKGQKINDYIWHYKNSDNNPYPLIYITIAPNTNKTITLLPPLVTLYDTPKRWVPPMEMIELIGDEIEIELDQNLFKNQIGIGFPSTTGTIGTDQSYSIYYTPKSIINENRISMLLNQYIPENQYIIDLTQEDSNISINSGTTDLSLSIKLGQKIDGVWTSNYNGITPKQLELVELFPEAMQSLLIGDSNSGLKLPDGIFINNTVGSEWSMPTRALYDFLVGGNIVNVSDGHVRLRCSYKEFDTCYLHWYISLNDIVDSEIEAAFSEIIAQLATATHFIFYLPHSRNNIYLN